MATQLFKCAVWLLSFGITPLALADSPAITGRTFIQDDVGDVFAPSFIESLPDSSMVVGGMVAGLYRPWAAKVDRAGKIIWIYDRHDPHPRKYGQAVILGSYAGAIPMADGSVFLCGTTPDTGLDSMGVISHIGPSGNLISEKLLHAQSDLADPSFTVSACIASDDGILIIGSDVSETFEVMFIKNDAVVWQTHLDGFSGLFFVGASTGRTTVMANAGGFVVSMTDNKTTAVLRLESDGRISKHVVLDGGYVMVRPTVGAANIDLFGPSPAPASGQRTMLHFDSTLAKVGEVAGDSPTSFEPDSVYRLRDGSLAFFGTSKHTFGRRLRAAIAVTNAHLMQEHEWDVPDDTEEDMGWIHAVAYLGARGDFAISRMLVAKGQRGTTVNFVNLK